MSFNLLEGTRVRDDIFELGRKEGVTQGIEQGIEKEKREIVIALYEKNQPIAFIAEVTHLSEQQILAILDGRE